MGHGLVWQHTYTMYSVIKCIHCASNTYLQSCSPSGCSASMFTLCSISIISLQTCGPLTGPRVYTHCVRYHNVYPSFIYCITAKLHPIHPPCLHTYIMQHLNNISAKLWPTGWSDSIHILCMNSLSTFCNELLHLCNLWPIQPHCLHTYIMQHINYISAKLWPISWSDSMHTLCRIS